MLKYCKNAIFKQSLQAFYIFLTNIFSKKGIVKQALCFKNVRKAKKGNR